MRLPPDVERVTGVRVFAEPSGFYKGVPTTPDAARALDKAWAFLSPRDRKLLTEIDLLFGETIRGLAGKAYQQENGQLRISLPKTAAKTQHGVEIASTLTHELAHLRQFVSKGGEPSELGADRAEESFLTHLMRLRRYSKEDKAVARRVLKSVKRAITADLSAQTK